MPRSGIRFLLALAAIAFMSLLGIRISSGAAPQQAPELLRQAGQLEQRGDLVGAEQLYSRYLHQSPDSAQGHANLGVVYAHLNKLDDAIREYHRALAGCGKIRCSQHTELAHSVFSDRNEDEGSSCSAVGRNGRAVGEVREPFLDLLAPCRDTTPHTFPAGTAVARLRMRTKL